MDELVIKILHTIAEYKIAMLVGVAGIALLLYGLISYGSFNHTDKAMTFEAADVKAETKNVDSEPTLVVDVEGAVEKPGVYKLSEGSRMQDALEKAGGMTKEADTELVAKQINLATKLTDSAKVYIPFKGESTSPLRQGSEGQASTTGSESLLNINSVSSKDLDSLPGIGEVTAGKIVNGRPYTSLDELVKKKIVSQKVFDQIKDKITVY